MPILHCFDFIPFRGGEIYGVFTHSSIFLEISRVSEGIFGKSAIKLALPSIHRVILREGIAPIIEHV